MTRPEQDHDEHDAQHDDHPRDQVVRNGNPGVPQSEYLQEGDLTPPPGPATQEGSEKSVGPRDDGD